ncbi:MAG: hypothetical protein KBA46_01675 [Candidatus Omnitrophica bacterium]|nr:hypothetical protein [Candidatus Omnitrophota bacterium]
MEEKRNFYKTVSEICAKDTRYKSDSYEFVMQALYFTQNKLKRQGHISGRELSIGLRDFAIELYGPMAKAVLAHWGITKTEDFGNIVFNMIQNKVLSKTEEDSLDDFQNVFDFEAAFGNIFRSTPITEIS